MTDRGMTVIKWGKDLVINNCHTIKLDKEAVFDEQTQTNLIGTRFVVSAVGLVHIPTLETQPHVEPVLSGNDATDTERHVRFLCMSQRQDFEMIVGADDNGNNGTTFLRAEPFRPNQTIPGLTHKDLNNGPRCLRCNVKHFTAALYRVEFTFELFVSECDQTGGNTNRSAILSITWAVSDEFDKNMMCTRTWTGQLRLATSKLNPHSFRGHCLPYLQLGMRRDKMSFIADQSGLTISFSIVDKQTYYSAIPPATSMSFSHTATTGDGKMAYIDVECTLAGDYHTDRRKLLSLCAELVESKLLALEGVFDASGKNKVFTVIESYALHESYDDDKSVVGIKARGMRTVTAKGFNSVIDASFGFDPAELAKEGANPSLEVLAWDTTRSRGNWKLGAAGPNGTLGSELEAEGSIAAISALSTYLQTPCSIDHDIKNGVKANPIPKIDNKAVKIKAYVAKEIRRLEPFAASASRSHIAAMYTEWHMQSSYSTHQHTVPMPRAIFSSGSIGDSFLDSVAHICLAPPSTIRTIRVKGRRIGKPPEFPESKSFVDSGTGIGFVLLRSNIVPATVNPRPGGADEYLAEAEIIYSLTRSPRPDEKANLPIGFNPWDVKTVQRGGVIESAGFREDQQVS